MICLKKGRETEYTKQQKDKVSQWRDVGANRMGAELKLKCLAVQQWVLSTRRHPSLPTHSEHLKTNYQLVRSLASYSSCCSLGDTQPSSQNNAAEMLHPGSKHTGKKTLLSQSLSYKKKGLIVSQHSL